MERSRGYRPLEGSAAEELLELGDAFFELNREWRIVRVNANQEKLSRKPRSQTLGRVFWEVRPETADPASRYWREYHRCMEQRVAVQFEDHFAPLDLWTGDGVPDEGRDRGVLQGRDRPEARRAGAARGGIAISRGSQERGLRTRADRPRAALPVDLQPAPGFRRVARHGEARRRAGGLRGSRSSGPTETASTRVGRGLSRGDCVHPQ